MNPISALIATAAVAVGTVKVAQSVARRLADRRRVPPRQPEEAGQQGEILDLRRDPDTGVYEIE